MNNVQNEYAASHLNDAAWFQRRQLQWTILLRIILYTLLIGLTMLLAYMGFDFILLPKYYLLFLLAAIYVSSILSAIRLRNIDHSIKYFGFFQSLIDVAFATAFVYFSGASNSIYSSIYFFPIITSGLIMPRRFSYFTAAAAIGIYGAILLLEFSGITPQYFDNYNYFPLSSIIRLLNIFAVKGLTFLLAALITSLFSRRLISTEQELSSTIDSFDKLSNLYKTIFDNIATGLITINSRNQITSANNAAVTLLGRRFLELIGNDITEVLPNIDLRRSGIQNVINYTRQNGISTRLRYSLTPLTPRKYYTPNSPDDPNADSGLITLQDVSKTEELEKKMRQGEKLAAIGMMSAGIAHDFRNPLTAISGSAQILEKELTTSAAPGTENIELTQIILRESNRMIATISDFLKFARPDNVQPCWFSLPNCVREVLQVCKAAPDWPENSRIDVYIEENTDIWADERQFFIVINHLIQNSMAFCPQGKELIRIDAREIRARGEKEKLLISVEDNGTGIADTLYEKIFEPFYTSRADGTGLGLAIVKQTIEAHGGTIEAGKSDILGGAKFSIIVPLVESGDSTR